MSLRKIVSAFGRTADFIYKKTITGLRALYCATLLLLLIPAALFYVTVRGLRKLFEKISDRNREDEIPPNRFPQG